MNFQKKIEEAILDRFPFEIYDKIFEYLDAESLLNLSQTSQLYQNLVQKCANKIVFERPCPNRFSKIVKLMPQTKCVFISDPIFLDSKSMIEFCELKNLQVLKIDSVSSMMNPSSLLRCLWSFNKLKELSLDFGQFVMEIENSSMLSLIVLSEMEILSLHYLPKTWDQYQDLILGCMPNLQTLDLTFNYSNVSAFKSIHLLKNLKNLSLQNCDNELIQFQFNHVACLETLNILNGSISSSVLCQMNKLCELSITASGWKKIDLESIKNLTCLQQLVLRINKLPNHACINQIFGHILSITLLDFDLAYCSSLKSLTKLESLSFHSPYFSNYQNPNSGLYPLTKLVTSLSSLITFSLVNSPCFPPTLIQNLATCCPNLQNLEISTCSNCLEKIFIEPLLNHRLVTLIIHCDAFNFTKIPNNLRSLKLLFISSDLCSNNNLTNIPWNKFPNLTKIETNFETILRPLKSNYYLKNINHHEFNINYDYSRRISI